MKCVQAKRLFGAYWDDEASQAEREWLDSHLASCSSCRTEYESFARTLEVTASLPRLDPAPDMLERVMARTRRSAPAPDRLPQARVNWIPVTSAAALLLTVTMMASPWMRLGPGVRVAENGSETTAPVEAQRVDDPDLATNGNEEATSDDASDAAPLFAAAVPDSLFDHSEDIEFILDPVTVRRGRATMTGYPSGVQGEHAVITF